ncbi:unnamed protein product [Macrosiphum euphorbiae]|uniref:Reverse transcriptase domain-containing protein n=1 Tax=Macrosiphum euphorbiae TaxID=13131 RepID=A0AAV0Y246_9HEMI|nr:unnamed protein product [Macrosiphum euphorbiae]
MCFGLRNAEQTFQRLVNTILAGLDFVFAYVDDVLVASANAEQHVAHVHAVLGRFEEFGIAINPAKCVFAASTLTFLGHVVDAQGLRPNPDSVDVVRRWPQPSTKKELQRFLGSLNFDHRFVQGAANLQAPLYDISAAIKKNDGPLAWTDAAREAFSAGREAFVTSALLVHPHHDAPLRLTTDASNIAIGAVLEQSVNNEWQPLGFFSRKLSGAQTRYSAYDLELLTAYLAARHFVHAIEGRLVTLRTDHHPLLFMFSQKSEKLIDRQARHVAFLSQYFHGIEHVSGELNVIPYVLSRLEWATFDDGLPDLKQWATDQARDTELQDIITGKTESYLELDARQTANGPVYFDIEYNRSRVFVPLRHRRTSAARPQPR